MAENDERAELRELIATLKAQVTASQEQKGSRQVSERSRTFSTYLVAVAGFVAAISVILVQFVETERNNTTKSRDQYELIVHSVEEVRDEQKFLIDRIMQQQNDLQQHIIELQQRIERLEKRLPEKGALRFYGTPVPSIIRIAAQSDQRGPSDTAPNDGDGSSKKPSGDKAFLLKEYILPSIYITLGLILLSSAFVSLASRDQGRKETAVDITKTLLSFFIGAATGQA